MLYKRICIISSCAAALAMCGLTAFGASQATVECTPAAKMESRTKDTKRDTTGWVPRAIMADEIHPTDAGYDLWMAAILPRLK